jgi:hypothetical protein
MANDNRRNPFAEALMAAGDSISGIYGQRGNTYATYLDSQNKRVAMEQEAIKQDIENKLKENQFNTLNTQRNASLINQERSAMNSSGLTPTSKTQLLGMNPMERMNLLKQRQTGDITGRYYVPKPDSTSLQADPSVAQKIANYEIDIKTIPGFGKSSVRNAYLKQVAEINPQFDQKQYTAASTFMTGLAKTQRGTPGGIVNSSNTFLGHLDFLDKNVDELKNSKLPAKNAIINFAKYQLGRSDITNLKQAQEVVGSELQTLLTGIGVTQEGLKAQRALLSTDASYDQQKAAIKTLVKIMKARVDPIQKQYETYGGKDPNRILTPESQSIVSKFGGSKIEKFSDDEEKAYQDWKASQK